MVPLPGLAGSNSLKKPAGKHHGPHGTNYTYLGCRRFGDWVTSTWRNEKKNKYTSGVTLLFSTLKRGECHVISRGCALVPSDVPFVEFATGLVFAAQQRKPVCSHNFSNLVRRLRSGSAPLGPLSENCPLQCHAPSGEVV